ncbi:V-SNARE [Phlyctema vagabunda]|uniref:V-SNARE n=1 Tax=Phlyctema vagabunda TaxID=108571 RepID=A0ABR4PAM6_9HELO
MARNKKRKLEHDSNSTTGIYNQRTNSLREEPRVDPTYGQRSAIPGLDGGAYLDDEDDLEYDEDDMGALAYLRSVRQEATGIPNLLVAPKAKAQQDGEPDHAIYNDGVGDHRGWYEGGAYVAAPESQTDEESKESKRVAQSVCYDSILERFENLRDRLKRAPPPELVQTLDSDHPIYLPVNSDHVVFGKWSWILKNVEPHPAQLASMNKGTAFRLLGMLTKGAMLKRGCEVSRCVSLWVWGLLARVPEAGELTNLEVSIIRELGKKVVLVGVGFKEAKEWKSEMDKVEADFEDQPTEQMQDYEEAVEADENNANACLDGNTTYTDDEYGGASLLGVSGRGTSNTERGHDMPATSHSGEVEDDDLYSNEATLATLSNDAMQSLPQLDENPEPKDGPPSELSPEELAAAKMRILARLTESSDECKPSETGSEPVPQMAPSTKISSGPEFSEEPLPMLNEGLMSSNPASEGTLQNTSATVELSPTLNTRVTLDMVLTVAGELYGQRDLLEFRESW